MARLITSGLEGKDQTLDGWTGLQGGMSYDAIFPRTSGGVAMKFATGFGATMDQTIVTTSLTTYYFRGYYAWDDVPDAGGILTVFAGGTGGTQVLRLRFSAGALQVINSAATVLGSVTPGWVPNSYGRVELAWKIDTTTTSDSVIARLNGVEFLNTTTDLSNSLVDTLRIQKTGVNNATPTSLNQWVDDIALNDSTGASQTSFPGEGVVTTMVPVADNAVGTGWTLSTGTAISSNGFDSVNNEPPQGVADLTALSDAKQIRNASSNANVDYKANTGTYLAAGIGLQDTITLVQVVAATAAPSATSPKSGNLGATNPTITLATIGTFLSGSTLAAGYPTGWKITRSAIAYAPTPTLGSAAVLDIQQVTASTRIAMVSFLGLVVEYVPALPPELMGQPFGLRGQQQMRQLLAQ